MIVQEGAVMSRSERNSDCAFSESYGDKKLQRFLDEGFKKIMFEEFTLTHPILLKQATQFRHCVFRIPSTWALIAPDSVFGALPTLSDCILHTSACIIEYDKDGVGYITYPKGK